MDVRFGKPAMSCLVFPVANCLQSSTRGLIVRNFASLCLFMTCGCVLSSSPRYEHECRFKSVVSAMLDFSMKESGSCVFGPLT